ncbi:hypothetical protein V1L52_02120 [Treponema sp. HNW]|uniref:hypothetical protein n=1 Tax=Treponema sp. HNW TaxID=3116654 RepID=UPI003D0C64ED
MKNPFLRLSAVFFLTAAALCIQPVFADEADTGDFFEDEDALSLNFGGKVQTVHGVQLVSPFDYAASRTLAEIRGEAAFGNSSAFVSFCAEYNYRSKSRTGFRLNEAYYRYAGDFLDFTAGRQIIAWGQSDGFRLTDVFSARDLRDPVGSDTDSSQRAVDALRLRFLHDVFTFEVTAVPFFTPDKLPPFFFESAADTEFFSIDLPRTFEIGGMSVPIKYSLQHAERPRKFTDTEAGARLSFFFPLMDFSLSGFYGWDKTPYYERTTGGITNPINVTLHEKYARIAMAGFDAAIPAGDFLIRLEGAWIGGRRFEPKEPLKAFSFPPPPNLPFNQPAEKNQLLLLAGFDWNYRGWFASLQYFEDLIVDRKDDTQREMHEGFVSFNISKTLLRDTLKLSAAGSVGANFGDMFAKFSADYALTDNLHTVIGADVYTKGVDGKGRFAAMKALNALWIKGTFSW